jgi:hypothetical protein
MRRREGEKRFLELEFGNWDLARARQKAEGQPALRMKPLTLRGSLQGALSGVPPAGPQFAQKVDSCSWLTGRSPRGAGRSPPDDRGEVFRRNDGKSG